jgi:preprotein translocase subunit SecE
VSFFQELVHVGIYKRNQGRITRQVTWGAIAAGVALGCWRLSETLLDNKLDRWLDFPVLSGVFPSLLAVASWWMAYRLVNLPRFADFLIAVEAEMNKVSWPSKGELYRASLVVLLVIFALSAILYVYDAFWRLFFHYVVRVF